TMKISKNKSLIPFDLNDDGPDVSRFGSFLNSILSQHAGNNGPAHSPPPPSHPPSAPSLEFRSIDGSGNNKVHTEFNATTGTDFVRIAPANFADGISTMVDGPNPRDISNTVVAGHGDEPNPQGLSGMMYAWGQFIDHDLDLEQTGGAAINIPIKP